MSTKQTAHLRAILAVRYNSLATIMGRTGINNDDNCKYHYGDKCVNAIVDSTKTRKLLFAVFLYTIGLTVYLQDTR